MKNRRLNWLLMVLGTVLAVGFSASVDAGSLRNGLSGNTAGVTGSLPGQVQWGYYETTEQGSLCSDSDPTLDSDGCNHGGSGDNILRLINPNGAANGNLVGAREQTVCAMIYVFDDDEEMGECCGCPLSSARLRTFSVEANLTSDWGLRGGPEGGDHGNGAIAIVASGPNTVGVRVGSSIVNPGGGGAAGSASDRIAAIQPTIRATA